MSIIEIEGWACEHSGLLTVGFQQLKEVAETALMGR
jgi:hypothetical protein